MAFLEDEAMAGGFITTIGEAFHHVSGDSLKTSPYSFEDSMPLSWLRRMGETQAHDRVRPTGR
jgi:hypothetical protein